MVIQRRPFFFLGDEMTAADFALKMGVTAYPFTVILNAEGRVLDRKRGYMDVQSLTAFMRKTLGERSS